jgi:hypothetical protein
MVMSMMFSGSTSPGFGMVLLKSLSCPTGRAKSVLMKKLAIGFLHDPTRGPGRFAFLRRTLQLASRRCKECLSI